jgi:phosphoheptose isomerase
MQDIIRQHFQDSITIKMQAMELLTDPVFKAGEKMASALAMGHKILSCGNGGSASDAQHFSGELLNRLVRERPPLAAIALNTDVATLTAISNDYHYDQIFEKQIQALGREGDILLAISTSGNSPNILKAIDTAHQKNMMIIALTGKEGGKIAKNLFPSDIELRVPAHRTIRIQEVHILIIHCLCDVIDRLLFEEEKA